jgi:citrate synthase
MTDKTWKTAITGIGPNEIRLRGYRLDELLGKVSVAGGVFLLFHSRLPTPEEERLYDAMLLSGIDHGVTPPSAQAARLSASTGAPLNGALAAGVLSINKYHGAAIEPAMRAFLELKEKLESSSMSPDDFARDFVSQALAEKRRLFGYGHRIHTEDPRTRRLFELAAAAGKDGPYLKLARAIGEELSRQSGRKLPLNVDGAIAALLCELQFPVQVCNFFFILPRVAGMTAHYLEEIAREKPMRRIIPDEAEYDGPGSRELEGER